MKQRDPKPEIQRLEELVSAVRHGEIRLPKFQRPFVWDRTDMLNLLDSIYNGYPIGSILLWHSSERLKSEKSIEGFKVDTTAIDNYPTNYLLDGQQRLTTLCGALYWEGSDSNSMWRIFFDLEKEQFTYAKDPIGEHLFPLNRLIKTSDFIKQCMKFESSVHARRYYEKAEKLLQSIKDYKVAVVKIGDISLDEVAPIFERINSTGRKLTMVDLMRAATWKDGFDLTAEIDRIVQAVEDAGFGEMPDSNVLRSIAAATGLGINKEDIDKLRSCSVAQLKTAADDVQKGLLSALDFLKLHVNLDDLSFLPYGLQLAHLTEFFRLTEPSKVQLEVLARWFWITSVTRHFGGASTGQNAKDLALIRSYAAGEVSTLPQPDSIDVSQFFFDQFNLRNASSTAFALLLKSARPSSTLYGRSFDAMHIKEKDRHVFEDLVPRHSAFSNRNIGQILNPFRDSEKSVQLDLLTNNALGEHLLTKKCIKSLLEADYETMIGLRATEAAKLLHSLTGTAIYFTPLE